MNEPQFDNWRKARASEPNSNCVEVAFAIDNTIGVRDSKHPNGPILEFDPAAWRTFLSKLRILGNS